MRINGINLVACGVAAIAMYAVGAVIYGVAFSDLWMSLSGYTEQMLAPHMWKMALSPVMPVLGAIGIAVVMRWRGVEGAGAGAVTGAMVFLFFSFASRLYGFTYGPQPLGLLALDSGHLLITHVIGGAIIGAMK